MGNHKDLRRKLRRDSTLPERLLWSKLKSRQIGFKFRRQESIDRYIVDFLYPSLKLVVEVDGVHHAYRGMPEYDEARRECIRELGYEIAVFSDQEVLENLEGVVETIKLTCEEISENPPVVPP
jgi:very-short-patch-repair endonuclease